MIKKAILTILFIFLTLILINNKSYASIYMVNKNGYDDWSGREKTYYAPSITPGNNPITKTLSLNCERADKILHNTYVEKGQRYYTGGTEGEGKLKVVAPLNTLYKGDSMTIKFYIINDSSVSFDSSTSTNTANGDIAVGGYKYNMNQNIVNSRNST